MKAAKGILLAIAVLALLTGALLPMNAQAAITGDDPIGAISLTETGSATWKVTTDSVANTVTIEGSISSTGTNKNGTPVDASGALTIARAGELDGTIEYSYSYTLTAGHGLGTVGSSSISGPGDVSGNLTGNKAISGNNTTSDSSEEPITLAWVEGSSLSLTIGAKGSKASTSISGGNASSATVTIVLKFTEYNINSVTFMPVDRDYTVTYYEEATSTTATTVTVKTTDTEGVTLTGELTNGFVVSGGTNYPCIGAQYTDSEGGTGTHVPTIKGIEPNAGDILTPIFLYDDNGVAPFCVGSAYFWTWESAFTAGAGGTVILNDNYTLPDGLADNGLSDDGTYVSYNSTTGVTTYTIPSGISLLAPYDKSDLTIGSTTTTNGFNSTLEHANVDFVTADSNGDNGGTVTGIMEPNTAVTYTLTIPSTTTVNVKSDAKFVVGGTLVGGTYSTTGIVSATAGAHSNIQLEGTINVEGGGILSTCGYILGGGTVNVASSGTVYQPHVFMDHKDGHYAYGAKEENSGNGYWPYNRHSLMNIRATLVLNSGSDMYGYVSMFTQPNTFASAQYNVTSTHIVGSSDELALFQLGSGTTMTITYSASETLNVTSSTTNINRGYYTKVGRTNISFRGDVTLGNIEMTLNVLNSDYNLSTAYSPFPISYNYNIVQESGTFYADNHMSLLPGSTFTVNAGAGLTIASGKNFVIFDGLRDYAQRSESVTLDGDDQTGGTWPVYHYPSSANLKTYGFSSTAELIMNGTLTVYGNLGGTVQTTGTTGKIVMDINAGTSASAQFGVQQKTVNLVVMSINGSSGKTTRSLDAQVFTPNSTTPITLEAGKTYCVANTDAHELASYTYAVYASHDASSATAETRTDLGATLTGSWGVHSYNSVVTAPTCVDGGYTTHTCAVCGDSYQDSPTDATGHSYSEYTFDSQTYNSTAACANGCGGTDDVYTPVRFAAIQLSAESEVILMLKLTVHEEWLNANPNAYIVLTKPANEVDSAGEVAEYTISEMTPDANGRYILTQGIASGEMTSEVSFQVFGDDGNAVTVSDYGDDSFGTTLGRTVADYAALAFEKGDNEIKALSAAMMLYGGYAQTYFGVDDSNPAYNTIPSGYSVPESLLVREDYPGYNFPTIDIDNINLETLKEYTRNESGDNIGLTFSSQDITLASNISMTCKFNYDSDSNYSVDKYTFVLTYTEGWTVKTIKLDPTVSGNTISVTIDNIPAAYWDYNYTISVTNEDTGTSTYVFVCSVMAYVNECLTKFEEVSAQKDLVNLVKAMYVYGTAASAYFRK